MATIGTVRKLEDRYSGSLNTLSIKAQIEIVPVSRKASDQAPDYRVYSSGAEIGAGWLNVGRNSGKNYVRVRLDDPAFPCPLYANLGRAADQDDDDVFALIWDRGGLGAARAAPA